MSDTTITSIDDAPAAAEAKPATKAKAEKVEKTVAKTSPGAAEAGLTGERKTITIHAGEGTAGREDVPVFVNGFGFQIKRGKPVEVPIEVVEVLKNAVTTQYENGEAIEVPRFAFSVH